MIQDYQPLLMNYQRTKNPHIGYGDKPRPTRFDWFVKGFHIGNGKFVNNLDGMVWGTNSYIDYLTNIDVDCTKTLNKPNQICSCPNNTWMRGQKFPTAKANRYLSSWEKNYCSVLNGYFNNNCETV
jgi:hypothetical protein